MSGCSETYFLLYGKLHIRILQNKYYLVILYYITSIQFKKLFKGYVQKDTMVSISCGEGMLQLLRLESNT